MKENSIKGRVIAVLLLLVFFQQMGAGLYIHNLLHDDPQGQMASKQDNGNKEISFACSCVDNFLMPFVEADEPVALPPQKTHITAVDSFSERIYFTSLIFSSLRGPPVL